MKNSFLVKQKVGQKVLKRKDLQLQLIVLAMPAVLIIFIFNYIPIGGLFLAFKNVNYTDGIFKSPWVGLNNFKFFFTSGDAFSATRNTLLYNLSYIVFGTIIAVGFAIMLNEITRRSAVKIFQTLFFFPYFFS